MGNKITNEDFIKIMSKKRPDTDVLGKYINMKTKITVKCKICGHIWDATPNSLLHSSNCPICSRDKRIKNGDVFKEELLSKNPNITLISKYTGTKNKVRCMCNICSYVWEALPHCLIHGLTGCPNCNHLSQFKEHSTFIEELSEINPNIEILSKYRRNSEKVKCKCKKDGSIWFARPSHLLIGKGCPICKESKGERKITDFLSKNNIDYIPQYSFEGLVGINGGMLSYDFYLPNYNMLIEYQGEFHDGSIPRTYLSDDDYKRQKEHDKRKKRFAIDNDFRLLEIWYWDFNKIENILAKNLNVGEQYGEYE